MEIENERIEELNSKMLRLVGMYTIEEIRHMVDEIEKSILKGNIIIKDKPTKVEEIQILLERLNCYDNLLQLAEALEKALKGKIGTSILLKLIGGQLGTVKGELICEKIINILGFNRTMQLVEIYEQLSDFNSYGEFKE